MTTIACGASVTYAESQAARWATRVPRCSPTVCATTASSWLSTSVVRALHSALKCSSGTGALTDVGSVCRSADHQRGRARTGRCSEREPHTSVARTRRCAPWQSHCVAYRHCAADNEVGDDGASELAGAETTRLRLHVLSLKSTSAARKPRASCCHACADNSVGDAGTRSIVRLLAEPGCALHRMDEDLKGAQLVHATPVSRVTAQRLASRGQPVASDRARADCGVHQRARDVRARHPGDRRLATRRVARRAR